MQPERLSLLNSPVYKISNTHIQLFFISLRKIHRPLKEIYNLVKSFKFYYMKKSLFTLFVAACVILTSCVKDQTKAPETPGPIDPENQTAYDRFNTISTLNVPVQEGKLTVVTFNGDIICLTQTPTTIPVPKSALSAKAGDKIEISYVDAADPKYVEALGENNSSSVLWQTIAFEDSMVGDYDYNDIVLHLCYQLSTRKKSHQKLHVGIHPIAYGATKTFKLGFNLYYGDTMVKEAIIADNAKEALFLANNGKYCGVAGMINTSDINYYSNFFTKVITLDAADVRFGDIKVVWFIEIEGGRKLYTVNNRYNFLDENKRPYGLAITDTGKIWDDMNGNKSEHSASWFEYPKESISMSVCYPDAEMLGANSFDAWIAGTAREFNMRRPDTEKVFNITQKEKGHFLYQIENGNSKDLGSNSYNKERTYIELPDYQK